MSAESRRSPPRSWLPRRRKRKTEHRRGNSAGPGAIGGAFGRRRHRQTVDDEIAHLIDALALIPGGAWIELDTQRGGQHGGREILDIVANLRLGHAETMVLRDVAIMRRIFRPGEAYSRGDVAAGLVGFGARHDAEGDLAGRHGGNPGGRRDEFALGRQDRGDSNEILLLDIRIAQRVFEGVEQVPVNADAAGQEYAFRNGKHSPPATELPLAIANDRAVSANDIVRGIANFHV